MVLRGVIYALGGAARRAGVAMDAAGSRLQGPTAYSESLLGAVSATPSVSVWYGATVRGDVAPVSLADRSAVMDGAIVGGGASVGAGAVVGAAAVMGDGAVLGEGAVVGAGAVLGERVVVEANGVVDAGAVVPSNTTIQAGTRHSGAPAVLSGSVLPAEVSANAAAVDEVVTLATAHAAENAKSAAQVRSEALLTELKLERSQDNLAHMGLLGKEEEIAATQAAWYEREERKQAEAGGRRQQG